MEEIQVIVTEVLVSIILGLVALAGSYAVYYIKKASDKLKAETEKLENEDAQRVINDALKRLSQVAELTVNKIEQKSAKVIRESVKDGKVSEDELRKFSTVAYDEILKVLEPEYKELLNNILGDAETYILNLIEDKLVEVKNRDQVLTIPLKI